MFKSGLTSSLYHLFVESYQTGQSHDQERPFVFVDDQRIRFIANTMSGDGPDQNQITAITIVDDEAMEILAFD